MSEWQQSQQLHYTGSLDLRGGDSEQTDLGSLLPSDSNAMAAIEDWDRHRQLALLFKKPLTLKLTPSRLKLPFPSSVVARWLSSTMSLTAASPPKN